MLVEVQPAGPIHAFLGRRSPYGAEFDQVYETLAPRPAVVVGSSRGPMLGPEPSSGLLARSRVMELV